MGIQVGKHKARCGGNFVSLARGTDGPGQQASLPHRSNGTLRSRVYGMCARRTNRHDSLSSEYSIACDYGISAQAPRSKLCLVKPVIRWHCCIDDEEVTTTGKHRRQACDQIERKFFPYFPDLSNALHSE